MGFHFVKNDNAVCGKRIFVAVKRDAVQFTVADHFHGGDDGHTHAFFCNVIAGKYCFLPFGGGSAVAAHGRDNKGAGFPFFQHIADGADKPCQVGDTAAAHCQADIFACQTFFVRNVFYQLPAQVARHIGQMRCLIVLPDGIHGGKRDIFQPFHRQVNFREMNKHGDTFFHAWRN